ncbi:6691_t:CDS:1, partial [Racocetra persica]
LDEPLVLYSCHNQKYYPSSAEKRARAHIDYDYVLETDVCYKYKSYIDMNSGMYYTHCDANIIRRENERRTKKNRDEF